MADKKITRQLSIFINGKEIKNSLGGIGREIGRVKAELKEANDPSDIKRLKAELDSLGNKYGEVKKEIHGTNVTLQEARGHFDNLLGGLLSGDLEGAKAGLIGLKSGVVGLTKSALAFIATPIGAAIAALALIGGAAKAWLDFNLEVEKTNQLVKDITNETGETVDAIRVRAEVLRDTFELDINESVTTAKSLVKSFGISYDEAFDIVEDGAIRGKLSSAEFLDSLKEYPIQFKNAGFSATDFANIVSTGIDLSIYSDKLPDAIKEFNLSITESTKASRDALVNAFGKEFTGKLFADIKSGAKTPKEALQSIALEADRIGLNSQQAQQLTADLFRGAGEDAGGALKVFEAVNIALNEQKKPLTEIQQIQQEQLEVNKELKGVYTQLFASADGGFGKIIEKGKLFASKILLNILKAGVDVYNWFVDLNNESGTFSALLQGMGVSAKGVFKVIGILISGAADSFKGLGSIVEGVFTLNFDKIKEGFANGVGSLGNALKKVKDQAKSDAAEILEAFNGNKKLEKIELKDLIADGSSDVGGPGTNGNNRATSEAAAAAQAQADAKLKIFKKAEEELTELIKQQQLERQNNLLSDAAKEQALIDQKYEKLFNKYQLSEQDKTSLTLEQIAEREDLIKQLEEEKALEKQEAKIARDAAFKEQLDEIEEENRILDAEAKFEREEAQAETDEARALIMLEKARYLALQQIQIERDKEIAKVGEVENAEKLKQAIRDRYLKKESQAEIAFTKGKEELDKKTSEKEKILDAQRLKNVADLFGGISQLLGEHTTAGKAAGIAQATINTYQGISEVWASKPESGLTGAGFIQKLVTSGLVLAQGLGTVRKIAATKTTGFKDGGPTGNKAIYNDAYGKVTGVVHEDEWVAPKFMTENPRYAETFQWLEQERMKQLGKGYYEGGSTSNGTPIFAEATQSSNQPNNEMSEIMKYLQRLNDNLNKGFKAYVVKDLEEFEKQKKLDLEYEQILNNTKSQ